MGFTIEDMMIVAADRYQMQMIAGKQGWSNSISWLLMLEDDKIIQNFSGKELAVTTGLGFRGESAFLQLVKNLYDAHAAGLIVNTGPYISTIPDEAIHFCDTHDFPLFTVPWDVYLADMIKDLSIRVFLQGTTDEEISKALICAIEQPEDQGRYVDGLRPYFDVDGIFQVIVLSRKGLDSMDTVERKRLSYRLQLSLSNLTHNGHFFYYDSVFVVVINALETEIVQQIINNYKSNIQKRLPDSGFVIGIGSQVADISLLSRSYKRARAAAIRASYEKVPIKNFDRMGIYRLLYSVEDQELLKQLGREVLKPLLEYDEKHGANYVETLESYLRNEGSIQRVSEELFIHRNTINYRMTNIRKLLNCDLKTAEEKMNYQLACLILHM